MGKHVLAQFQTLVFADEALKGIQGDLPPVFREKLLEGLAMLNEFGTDPNYSGKRMQNTGREGIWELKIKGPSKTEWRFLFKNITQPNSPFKYGLLNFFLKKDEKISTRDFEAAVRIAKREGW